MNARLVVGEVLRPHGIAGMLKIRPYVDDKKRFLDLKKVYIDGETHKVLKASVAADAVYVCLSGVADRNAAELFRGKFLEIDREDAVALEVATIVVVTRALAVDPTKIVENKIEIVIVPMTTK